MSFFWVQSYGYGPLPTIFEHPMGDILPVADQANSPRQDPSSSQYQQGQSLSQQHGPNQQGTVAQQQPMSAFSNMSALGLALPSVSYGLPQQGQHPQQQFSSASAPPAVAYHIGQASQFAVPHAMNQALNPAYAMQHYQQYQNVYQPHMPQSSLQTMHQSPSPSQHYFPTQGYMAQQQSPQAAQMYWGHYPQQLSQAYPISPQQYDRSAVNHHPVAQTARRSSEQLNIGASASPANRSSSSGTPVSLSPSVPRGPPRKPKQSGNALWVGNLPNGASILELKDHFSRDAMNDIESVFLISKSNCAFVNYKTEASCAAAMQRFHESRFHSVRLVCRLRRQSSPATPVTGVPTGPAALTSPHPALAKTPTPGSSEQPEPSAPVAKVNSEGVEASLAKDKFFIVKSLTMEDLDASVRNNIWATQSHNEAALNKAYEMADNVYLIFSANKSGTYFGYARMASPINDDPAAAIEFAPTAQAVEDPDQPKAISTEATSTAPRGRVIDDSARGTIFWEAETPELEGEVVDGEVDSEEDGVKSDKEDEPEGVSSDVSKAWGKPFKLEWISTHQLPFYRTRGLRNPWNSNREVKIARDGTELETSVGRKLIQMFHQNTSPPVDGHAMPPMGGPSAYPQMRFI